MKFRIRRNSNYLDVQITEGSTVINLGLLSDGESRALASDLQEAIDELLRLLPEKNLPDGDDEPCPVCYSRECAGTCMGDGLMGG